MVKLNDKHFELFKRECKKFINLFELNNWDVSFKFTEDKINNAFLVTDRVNYQATIKLSKEIDDPDISIEESVKQLAKHETAHLLIARLSDLGTSKYITRLEYTSAEEELVIKLMHIIS
jgi:hypothetical protein